MASHSSQLRVAIVGGGIAGLMAAISLAPFKNIQIDIYEGASKFETIGAGLMIWGEAVSVMRKLGIEDRLVAIAPGIQHPNLMHLRRANFVEGRELGNMAFSRAFGFHRGTLLDTLLDILKETNRATIHFGKRCVSYIDDANTNGDVVINFKDGTTATCDALLGCDGIKSVVRKQLMEGLGWRPENPKIDSSGMGFIGTVVYRALIDPTSLGDHPARKMSRVYIGSYTHIVSYPIAGGKFINFVGYSTNVTRYDEWRNGEWTFDEEGIDEVIKEFVGLEEEVQILLRCIQKTSRWALYDIEPLPHWSDGRVTVLGDAIHAMPPFIGSGGGQSFEDAYILAQLLGNPQVTRKDIPYVLRSYEHIRKDRADKVLHCTRECKRALQSMDEFAEMSDEDLQRRCTGFVDWLWEGQLNLDEEVKRGIREFERLRKESEV